MRASTAHYYTSFSPKSSYVPLRLPERAFEGDCERLPGDGERLRGELERDLVLDLDLLSAAVVGVVVLVEARKGVSPSRDLEQQ